MTALRIALALCLPLAAAAADWQLVWSDEFNRNGSPDPSKWNLEEGFIANQELQFYTSRKENVHVADGKLIIEARRESVPNPGYEAGSRHWARSRQQAEYTSARVRTFGKADWKYGRFVMRAKLPSGRGTWPAFWMLGSDCDKLGWPACGEIDIMEYVGYDPGVVHANIHTKARNHVLKNNKGGKVAVPDAETAFHDYVLEWTPAKMDFFVDEKLFFTYTKEAGQDLWPFDKPYYLILNLAVGGSWGGQKGVDTSQFPARYEIDYVRVYSQK